MGEKFFPVKRKPCFGDVPPIIWTPELLGVFLLSKLTRQQKLDIYAKRQAGHTISQLALEYGINKSGIEYLCRLIDKHSPDILRQDKNRYYSSSLKLQIINRVLIDHQGIRSTAIEFGLPDPWSASQLDPFLQSQWICYHREKTWEAYDYETTSKTIHQTLRRYDSRGKG